MENLAHGRNIVTQLEPPGRSLGFAASTVYQVCWRVVSVLVEGGVVALRRSASHVGPCVDGARPAEESFLTRVAIVPVMVGWVISPIVRRIAMVVGVQVAGLTVLLVIAVPFRAHPGWGR